ncbi:MAG: hypothetical protein WCF18_07515 [Chthoniobacteraceae bacterium]
MTPDEEPTEEDELYPFEVDPSRMMTVFRAFVLFDELFLHMQAMNVAIVDQYLLSLEQDLLREYIEMERTPTDSAIFVSALSQMWIFSTYELLRTWRQRIRELIQIADTKKRPKKVAQPHDELNLNKHMREHAIETALNTPGYADLLRKHDEVMLPIFRACEAIRIPLAKHETAKSHTVLPHSPGYARINMLCGAMDFEVIHSDHSFEFINRRDIAEAIRKIDIDALPTA